MQHAVSLSSLKHYLLDLDLCQLHITVLAIQLQVNSHRWFVRLDQISSLLWFFPSILRSLKGWTFRFWRGWRRGGGGKVSLFKTQATRENVQTRTFHPNVFLKNSSFAFSTACVCFQRWFAKGCVDSQRALNLSPEPQWEPGLELELLELLEELEPPLPLLPVVLGTSFSTRSHSSRGSAELQGQQRAVKNILWGARDWIFNLFFFLNHPKILFKKCQIYLFISFFFKFSYFSVIFLLFCIKVEKTNTKRDRSLTITHSEYVLIITFTQQEDSRLHRKHCYINPPTLSEETKPADRQQLLNMSDSSLNESKFFFRAF